MSFPNKPNNWIKGGGRTFEAANGLDTFLKTLEKEFFASVKVKCKYNNVENRADLILDLYLNFGIVDCLRHFNKGNWSDPTFSKESSENITVALTNAVEYLNAQNSHHIDILEMSFHFKETSIVVSRLYQKSIPEQIGDILYQIGHHFVYFTKGLTEMPYEIFVPVFEDTMFGKAPEQQQSGYFDYWGLYFDEAQQHKAMIYSLEKRKLQEEDLFLFE
ncbi:MAG: hypothetical protein ABGX00_13965 [Allomuricauda sp.]